MNNNLTLANQARLDKVLNRLYSTRKGIMTLREYLDTYATGFESILEPSVQYNRIKYNRMNNEQQDEYQKKLDKEDGNYTPIMVDTDIDGLTLLIMPVK